MIFVPLMLARWLVANLLTTAARATADNALKPIDAVIVRVASSAAHLVRSLCGLPDSCLVIGLTRQRGCDANAANVTFLDVRAPVASNDSCFHFMLWLRRQCGMPGWHIRLYVHSLIVDRGRLRSRIVNPRKEQSRPLRETPRAARTRPGHGKTFVTTISLMSAHAA
jgi:hypothetical protein